MACTRPDGCTCAGPGYRPFWQAREACFYNDGQTVAAPVAVAAAAAQPVPGAVRESVTFLRGYLQAGDLKNRSDARFHIGTIDEHLNQRGGA